MASYRPDVEILIAEPCSESWEAMDGDARVRHCAACECDVVNTAAMTPREIEAMLAKDGPMPCLRVAKYADGSMLVTSEPRTQAAYGRVARVAMAALVTISAVAATGCAAQAPPILLGKRIAPVSYVGRVVDPNGRPVAHVSVHMLRKLGDRVEERTVETDAKGKYEVSVMPGEWEIEATKEHAFASRAKVQVGPEGSRVSLPLVLMPMTVTAGLVAPRSLK